MGIWKDLIGTSGSYFKLGFLGVRLKNSSGNLLVRNTGDSADAEITVSKLSVSGEVVDLNSDAASTAADWKYTLRRPITGMTAAVDLTLPIDDGTPSQVLSTDGAGILSWVSAASTAASEKLDTTSLAYNSSGTVAMFSTGAADVIERVQIIVDTAFNGTAPAVSIGISGSVSKYMASTQVDLSTVGVYEVHPGIIAAGVEALIATFTAGGGASTGAARIIVLYATPT